MPSVWDDFNTPLGDCIIAGIQEEEDKIWMDAFDKAIEDGV